MQNFDNSLFPQLFKVFYNNYLVGNFSSIDNQYLCRNLINFLLLDTNVSTLTSSLDLKKYVNPKMEVSKNIYYSLITRMNWIDEIEFGNIMGLLIQINPKNINKTGYNLDYIPILNTSHSIISLEQLLEAYDIYYKNYNSYYDDFFSDKIISGFGLGNGNSILPLYINKDHWDLVQLYKNYNLGLIFNRNPLNYNFKHISIYYNIAIFMISKTFSDKNYCSDKWLHLMFSVLRTIYEMVKYEPFLIKKFIKNPIYRLSSSFNKLLIQSIFSNDESILGILFEEMVRKKFKSIYKSISILDSVYNFKNYNINTSLNYEYNYKTNKNLNHLDLDGMKSWIENLEDNIIFSELITQIYGIAKIKKILGKNYQSIFNKMDEYGGVIPEDILFELKISIKEKFIRPVNYKLKYIINDKFKNHINTTNKQKFSIDTLKELNVYENDNQLYAILIQSLIQRVDKCRKKAIKNKIYMDCFLNPDKIINKTALLINHRYVKNYYHLYEIDNYVTTINSIQNEELILFIINMVSKTVSLKNKILTSPNLNVSKKILLEQILTNKTLPFGYKKFEFLI